MLLVCTLYQYSFVTQLVCICMSLVCARTGTRISSYVLVCICVTRMYSIYSFVTRMYSYVTCMCSYVLVCIRMLLACVRLIEMSVEYSILLKLAGGGGWGREMGLVLLSA